MSASRLRRAVARLPAACWGCIAIAFVNGVLWALIIPPFQIPDEIDHVGYVQYVAERGRLPRPLLRKDVYSPELVVGASRVPFNIETRPDWFARDERRARRAVEGLDRRPLGTGASAINNPPLYYVLDTALYGLARSSSIYDRVFVMRLLSALLAAITVGASFLFVREILPTWRWAPTVGALAVAFQPMLGFMSGGVNNDNLLYACGAVFIYLIARTLRRGLTPGLGVALGLVALAGLLTKTGFAGLLPGGGLAVLVAVWRAPAEQRRRAIIGAATAGLILAIPFCAWVIANASVFDRGGSTTAGFNSHQTTQYTSLHGQLSYLWQSFLPALPGMQRFQGIAHAYPVWDFYFQGFVGRFGWWRFTFPLWVHWVALSVYVCVLALAGASLARARRALRGRWIEVLCYVVTAGGLLLLVEVAAYRYQARTNASFEQTRYLLPLLPFYAGLVAVAAIAAGRRWGPVLGAVLLVGAMAHSLFAMLLVIGHYYA